MKVNNRIFLSYAPGDKVWKDRLVALLESLQKQELLDLYPVDSSHEGIDGVLERARVAVLLLSKEYLDSGFIVNHEVGQILDRREKLGLEIVPVIVRPCNWDHIERLASKRSWPRTGTALSEALTDLIDRELEALAATLVVRPARCKGRIRLDAREPLAADPRPSSPQSEIFLKLKDMGPPNPPEPRWLQGQVYEEEQTGWRRRFSSFRAGNRHQIRLRVGPGDEDWSEAPEPFDETPLPVGEKFHRLEVILASMVLPESIQIKSVQLPADGGPSTEARFEVTVPEELGALEASITVLYENQHLQAGLLRGCVTSGSDDAEATESIVLLPGQASRVNFMNSASSDSAGASNTQRRNSSPPDLSLQLSSDVVIVSLRHVKTFAVPLTGLAQVTRMISEKLEHAAMVAAQLGVDQIDRDEGLILVRTLAAHGRYLRNLLHIDGDLLPPGNLKRIRRVQVVSPFSAEYLPVEFFYDGPTPQKNAQLCDQFKSAARGDGACHRCRALSDGGRFVCPLLFWGLNRIIERQIRIQPRGYSESMTCTTQVEPMQGNDTLGRLEQILLAVSNRVEKADQLATLEAARAIDPEAHAAKDWDEWKDWTEKAKPGLLVALPHNVTTNLEIEALEIGDRELLRLDEIETRWPRSERDGPVVLLLGCSTAQAKVTHQDFIDRIRCRGAAVVVGTLTRVLGRHSAPVAREFLHQLNQEGKAGLSTFGEVMRRVRRRMLRAGNVMSFALVAYGSSEWRLKGCSAANEHTAFGLSVPSSGTE